MQASSVNTSSGGCCRPARRAALCLALLAAVLALPAPAWGQWDVSAELEQEIQSAIGHIYNLEFYDANTAADKIIRERPDHPVGHFFKAMVEWWRILTNFQDESRDDTFEEMLETVIDICDERLERNPDDVAALFFKGGSLGFRGRLRANRGNWVGAARDGVAALPIVRRAHELAPDNTDVLLGIGIYNYYAEVVPDRYPLVKPLMIFFPSGDRAMGLQQLERAAREARYASSEAKYFLAQSYYQFERDYARALECNRSLHDRYPRNPLFQRGVGRSLVGLGRWDEAFELFFDVQRRCQERWIGYDDFAVREATYYIGQSYFHKKLYDDAWTALELCAGISEKLDTDEESGFWVMAVLTLGKISDARGRRAEAKQLYERVLDMPDYHDAHRQAEVFLSFPYQGH